MKRNTYLHTVTCVEEKVIKKTNEKLYLVLKKKGLPEQIIDEINAESQNRLEDYLLQILPKLKNMYFDNPEQNLRILSEKLSFDKLIQLRVYSGLIIIIENYLLILTACFLLFGAKIAKCTGFLAVTIDLLLVHNPVFYGENVYRGIASQYLGILGGILVF